ncbi:NACHT domain-containing protein [Nonomuraea ceibae]|uniref:NACHT domain-containing protein n=1 Tax=Nonomuraea ceibae TaxID=1935170 RepID=UPI001C5FFFB5|nr:NACHT domain-containing protein [Nonomuraea ceibae]
MNRRKIGWRVLFAALTVLAAGAVVAVVWRVLDPEDPVNRADLAAVMLAAAMLAGTVVVWARRSATTRADASTDTRSAVDTAAHMLAGLVGHQWRTEARHRLLDDPEPIPVRWQLIADETVMSQPRLITTEAELTLTGRSDDIAALADAFRALARRRLVIAGGAGMGKTTLAIQLLLQLLATRAADQAAAGEGEVVPVPVLLPVSGWDISAHPRLQDWLAVRLIQDYPALAAPEFGAGAAAALADGGHILAVLDGLDEIPAPARAQVIAALNASLTARDQLILTSRRTEFATAIHDTGRPLTAAAVIVPQPVPPQAAADYLTACLPASPTDVWRQTLTALRSRTVPGLTRLAATPLGLWLIRTVYVTPGADPAPLTGPLGADAGALRAHLLDHVIPAVIAARPPSTGPADHFRPRHRLDPDATRRHLTYLAHAFPPVITRDITWWHIARTTPRIRSTVGLATGIVFGLVFGLVGLELWLLGPIRVVFGLLSGLVFGLAVGLVRARSWVNETPGCYAGLRLRGRVSLLIRSLKGTLAFGLTIGFIVGLTMGFVSMFSLDSSGIDLDPDFHLVFGFVFGLLAWLGTTLASGLIAWAEQPTLESTSTPRSSWRADRALTLLRLVMAGLTCWILFGIFEFVAFAPSLVKLAGLGLGLVLGLVAGLTVGLSLGLPIALVAGFVMGKHHAWLVCTIAVTRLALQRRLPWRLMNFLDNAHRLGLLRAVGPVYQFRHAALHDHLASADMSHETSQRIGHSL